MNDLVESFSGVRGIWGRSIREDFAERYGYAYARWVFGTGRAGSIVIARDTRSSSLKLTRAMIRGLDAGGCTRVVDLGVLPTPAACLAVRWFRARGGVIVTASHNEPTFNGWKFLSENGSVLAPRDMDTVIRMVPSVVPDDVRTHRLTITDRSESVRGKYIRYLRNLIPAASRRRIRNAKLSVAVDPNGGTAAVILRPLLSGLGVRARFLHMRLGAFQRTVDPKPETLTRLASLLRKKNVSLGAGFDCDADRVGIVFPNSSKQIRGLDGNAMLALLLVARLSRARRRRGPVVLNDATSDAVRDTAAQYGVRVRDVEVGEINVVSAMDRLKSPIGGEGTSGGAIIPPGRSRDGMAALMLLLDLLATSGASVDELMKSLPSYVTLQAALRVPASRAAGVSQRLVRQLRKAGQRVRRTGGGIKVRTSQGFFWFRQSQTEAGVWRIIADARTEKDAKGLLKTARRYFREAQ